MMNDIITNHEYRELLRTKIKRGYRIAVFVILGVGFIYLMIGTILLISSIDSDEDPYLWALMFFVISILASIVIQFLSKRVDQKESPHFSYDQFVDYETTGTKIPMYRVVQRGKNSQTIYCLVDFKNNQIEIFDHRRKGLKPYKNFYKDQIKLVFYYKTKDGYDIIKKKVDILANTKKYHLYGFPEINENMIDFCKVEGYQVDIK